MTVKEIVKKCLEDNGFDGLYSPGECACVIKDLLPCDNAYVDCEAGYIGPCDCGDHDYHIGPEKHQVLKCCGCGKEIYLPIIPGPPGPPVWSCGKPECNKEYRRRQGVS